MASCQFNLLFGVYLSLLVLFCDVCFCDESGTCLGDFELCTCHKEKVECHGEKKLNGGDIINLYDDIDDECQNITITGSHFGELQKNFLGSCANAHELVLKKLTYLELSNCGIKTVHGKSFHCIPHLQTLILRDNQWQIDLDDEQIGYFTSMPEMLHLDLTNAFEDGEDGSTHFYKLAHIFKETDMTMLEQLELSHNEFIVLGRESANSMCQLTRLKFLNLSHNYFTEPAMPTEKNCFQHLEVLDLSHNDIDVLSPEFMTEVDYVYKSYNNLQHVYLNNNPFKCDCGLIDTWTWLSKTSSPVDKDAMLCSADSFHSSYAGKAIISLTLDDLQCQQVQPQSNIAVHVVTGIIFTVIGITVVAFAIFHR